MMFGTSYFGPSFFNNFFGGKSATIAFGNVVVTITTTKIEISLGTGLPLRITSIVDIDNCMVTLDRS